MKYLIKLYFIYFYIFFCRDLSFALGKEDIVLRWPSLNIISSILKINGLFIDDLYTNSTLNSPLRTIINIFSTILPKNHLEFISAYSIFSLILKSLLPITLIFFASTITILILREFNPNKSINIKIYFSHSFFIGNLIFFISKQSEYLKDIFFGTPIALWGFPTALASSRGIALFISLIAVNITFLMKLIHPINYKLSKKLLIVLFFINLSASIIHPISPLFSLVIAFLLNLLINKNLSSWLNLFFVYFVSWLLGVLLIFTLHPQENIDNLDLFRIYVENAHYHHYLPSFYIIKLLKWKFLICNFIISIFLIISQKNNNFLKGIFKKLFLLNIFLIVLINLNQYIFVEIYKQPLFIKLGLTFLNISYNFFYFVSILLFFSLITTKYKTLLHNIFEFKFIKSTKSLRFINLFFISLSICTLILTSSVYQSNFIKIQESISYILGNKIKLLNKENSAFIIDTELSSNLKYPRELGLINIFYDSYFPFNIENIKLWEKKSNDLKELENCLKSEKENCYLPMQYKKNILYISKINQEKLGEEIFNEKIKNIPIFINFIEKK